LLNGNGRVALSAKLSGKGHRPPTAVGKVNAFSYDIKISAVGSFVLPLRTRVTDGGTELRLPRPR